MANPRTIARLESRIQERAAYCLQFEIRDPRASFITVVRVELSSDLSSGKIFYSVLGGEAEKSKAEHMLEHAAGFIQRQCARVLEMRRVPHLRWIRDESAERASELAGLIREARERDRRINPHVDDQPSADDPGADGGDAAQPAGPEAAAGPQHPAPGGRARARDDGSEAGEAEADEFDAQAPGAGQPGAAESGAHDPGSGTEPERRPRGRDSKGA